MVGEAILWMVIFYGLYFVILGYFTIPALKSEREIKNKEKN
ncbi:hypothetical protein [Natranaerobius trueperi]|nr:hypothetical protein [Natranaerobius trueperi]